MKIIVEVELEVSYNQNETDITPESMAKDITIQEDNVIDGFTTTRHGIHGDPVDKFYLKDATLKSVNVIEK